ncbi:MAG: hypothetical protein FWJ90_04485 [Actinomadura sp.]
MLTALPAAVLVLPDAVINVVPAAASALELGDAGIPDLLRATGLSLPALVATVPLAAVAARRLPAWTVLLAGAAVLLAGVAGARLAGSVPLVAAVRATQGVGAGLMLPATLVLVWERGVRNLRAVWAGVFTGMLVLAMPLALGAVPAPAGGAAVPDWRVALAPFAWPAAVAVVAACVHPLLRGAVPRTPAAQRPADRGRLLLVFVPVAGFTFLAVVAAHEWSPGARLVVAAAALPALLGLAVAGDGHEYGEDGGERGERGDARACALALITVGLLCLPVAGPLAGLVSAAESLRGGPGAAVLPFVLAAAATAAGAYASGRVPERRAVPGGHCLMVVALLLGLAAVPHRPWTLLLPLVPLGAGAGLALAAVLRGAGADAALFGLSLCPPALLAGQLAVLSLQASELERLRPVTEAQRAAALLGAYRLWLLTAAVLAVLAAVASVSATRRRRRPGSPR